MPGKRHHGLLAYAWEIPCALIQTCLRRFLATIFRIFCYCSSSDLTYSFFSKYLIEPHKIQLSLCLACRYCCRGNCTGVLSFLFNNSLKVTTKKKYKRTLLWQGCHHRATTVLRARSGTGALSDVYSNKMNHNNNNSVTMSHSQFAWRSSVARLSLN